MVTATIEVRLANVQILRVSAIYDTQAEDSDRQLALDMQKHLLAALSPPAATSTGGTTTLPGKTYVVPGITSVYPPEPIAKATTHKRRHRTVQRSRPKP